MLLGFFWWFLLRQLTPALTAGKFVEERWWDWRGRIRDVPCRMVQRCSRLPTLYINSLRSEDLTIVEGEDDEANKPAYSCHRDYKRGGIYAYKSTLRPWWMRIHLQLCCNVATAITQVTRLLAASWFPVDRAEWTKHSLSTKGGRGYP
jgi:hypothetical protein